MKYSKKVLPNGLRIITVPMKDNPTATVMVLVEAGSKYETKDKAGISHFLEHICFKGTEKRPSSFHITRELDQIGATYNAFTSQEFTGYYAKARAENLPEILDIISDLYLNPVFPEKEIEKEKGVIVEEINMYEDTPQDHVQDMFVKLLYGDQPAGWNVAGTKEVVTRLKRDDFVKYRNKHYVSSATTIVVAGHIDEEKVISEIEKLFKNISRTQKDGKQKVIEKQKAPAILLKERKGDQAHLVLGVRTFDVYDKKSRVANLLAGVLGGGMSSRLFQKLRDDLGICYYVHAGNDASTDHGYFSVSAGVDVNRVEEAIGAILAELKKAKEELVSLEELNRVKEYIIGHLYLGLESSNSLANFYGFQEVLKRSILRPEEVVAELKAITPEQIQTIAKEIFRDERLNLALIGPYSDSKKFSSVVKF
ncbi:MAG: pitrilysin family protein [Candidatus Pacebacteria bacterium]|nr:pitrilysin family protein [Candidatus Paceibacterota bacterium]MDD5356944.1 pitrilysin family protein [Candidatus Paceibacterota bacterium]